MITQITDTIVLQYDKYAKGVEKEKASFSLYNILPLHISDSSRHPVLEIPEVIYIPSTSFRRLHKFYKYIKIILLRCENCRLKLQWNLFVEWTTFQSQGLIQFLHLK